MKRVFSVFLSFVLIFNLVFISFSYADTISDLNNVEIGSEVNIDPAPPTVGNVGELLEQNTNEAGYEPTGLFATLLSWINQFITQAIMIPLGLILVAFPTIDSCIFNKGDFFRLSFFEATPNGLAGSLQSSISAIYNAFRYLVTAAYIVILVYLAIRMMFSSVGRQKAHYKELFKHWIVGLLLLFSFHWIMAFTIWIANTLVGILADLSNNILSRDIDVVHSLVATMFPGAFSDLPFTAFIVSRLASVSGGSAIFSFLNVVAPILTLILFLFLLGSTFSIVLTYFKRLITIAILILVFPLVALSYVFDKIGDRKAQTLGIWLREFVVNVMIQPIHALVLILISLLFSTGAPDNNLGVIISTNLFGPHIVGAVMSILALRLIPMGEELLKKLFQINSNMGPGSQGIAGSMAKAGLAISGAKNMASSLSKIGKGATGFINRQKYGKELWNNSAEKKKLDAGRNNVSRALKIGDKRAQRDFLKGNKDYERFTKDMCEQAGTKTLAGARAKLLSQVSGASIGVGTAITGAGTDRFLAEASARATLGAETVNALAGTASKLLHGDLSKSDDYANRVKELSKDNVNIDNLDRKDKEKIATELGIHIDMVNGQNKDKIINAYREMEMPARYGASKDSIKKFNSLYKEQKNIQDGLMPDGSGPLDLSKIDAKYRYQTKNGTLANINGTLHRINNNGNSKLSDGEMVSFAPELKGHSVRNNSQILTRTHAEYAEHSVNLAQYEEKLNKARKELLAKESAYDTARENYDTARENLKIDPNNPQFIEDLRTAKSAMAVARTERNDANAIVSDIKRDISTAKSEMRKIEKSEVAKQMIIDDSFTQAGAQPYYSDTAFNSVYSGENKGQIIHDVNNTIQVKIDGNDSSYVISEAYGPATPRSTSDSTLSDINNFVFSTVMSDATNKQLKAKYEAAIAHLNQTLTSGNANDIQNASFNLSSVEAEVAAAANAKFAEFTSDPNSVLKNGGNFEIRDMFETNKAIQEETGKNFISNYDAPVGEAFYYGICDALTTALDAWSNKLVTINLYRASDNELNYTVFNRFTNGNMAQGTFNIDEKFTNEALAVPGNSVTIVYSKGGWFIK